MSTQLIERLSDEADLCRNEGANDIAKLLDEAVAALASVEGEPVATVTRFHDLGGEFDWDRRVICPVGAKLYTRPQPAQALDAEAMLRACLKPARTDGGDGGEGKA